MAIYSYSRITTFEQCPQKFKFRYIDKIIPEIEKSIEAHLGQSVHAALEWLYLQVKKSKIPNINEIILTYVEEWSKNFTPKLLIVNKDLTHKDYFNKGISFITSYYTEHHPFKQNTLDTEKKIILNLEGYKLQGYIDRLDYNLLTKEYEIHDYKTANSMPSKDKLKKDKQLALYSIAVKDIFGYDKEVRLIWHFLAHNKRYKLKKTNQELEELKKETIKAIQEIEAATEFPTQKSTLCSWCEYKDICPAWQNL